MTGLNVGGSSGECIYQSVAERKLLLRRIYSSIISPSWRSGHGNVYAVIKEIIRVQGGPDIGSVRAASLRKVISINMYLG